MNNMNFRSFIAMLVVKHGKATEAELANRIAFRSDREVFWFFKNNYNTEYKQALWLNSRR